MTPTHVFVAIHKLNDPLINIIDDGDHYAVDTS